MKKIVKYLFSFVVVLMLTGCVKYNMNMEISSDNSVNLELIYAVDGSLIESLGNVNETSETEETVQENNNDNVSVDDYDFLKEKGFTVEEYNEETDDGKKYSGVRISKKYSSINDITKDTEKQIDINKAIGDKETFDDSQFFSKSGNTYKANLMFDFSGENADSENGEGTEGIDMSSFASTFDLKYTIKLSVKATSNNATDVSEDGKTLTWVLKYGEANAVEYAFELPTKGGNVLGMDSSMIMYIGIGVLVVIILVIVLVFSKKKKNNDLSTGDVAPTMTAQQPVTFGGVMGQNNPQNNLGTVQPVQPEPVNVPQTQPVMPENQPVQPEPINPQPIQQSPVIPASQPAPMSSPETPVNGLPVQNMQPEQPNNQNNQ